MLCYLQSLKTKFKLMHKIYLNPFQISEIARLICFQTHETKPASRCCLCLSVIAVTYSNDWKNFIVILSVLNICCIEPAERCAWKKTSQCCHFHRYEMYYSRILVTKISNKTFIKFNTEFVLRTEWFNVRLTWICSIFSFPQEFPILLIIPRELISC